MRGPASFSSSILIAIAVLGVPHQLFSQAQPEIIRGRVTTDSGAIIAGATVIATMAPDRIVFRGTSDSSGLFRLEISEGTGDYLVYIAAVGRVAFRKRVTRTGTQSELVVDATLASAVQQLATVAIKAEKPTPMRGSDPDPLIPGDRDVDGAAGGASPDERGDLSALATMIPGYLRTGDGFSALGLPASQNSLTLNGMAFPGVDLPRDLNLSVRVATTPFDPARGWFSGAGVDARLTRPGTFTFKTVRTTMGARTPSAGGTPMNNVGASYSASGRVDLLNRYFYNFAAQANRQMADATTLLTAPASLMREMGIAGDSLGRLLDVLNSVGSPFVATSLGTRPTTESGSVFAAIEKNTRQPLSSVPAPTTYGLNAYGRVSRFNGVGLSPGSTPSRGANRSQAAGSLNGAFSHYFGPDYLLEVRSTLAGNSAESGPYGAGPGGRVLIRSDLDAGAEGTAQLLFGAGGSPLTRSSQLTWETAVDTKFYAPGQLHRVKISADARYDQHRRETSNAGMFSFASLEALSAGRADSYTRAPGGLPASAGVWNGFLAVGDVWDATSRLQINYGARLEGARFATSPDRRPDIDGRFGLQTSHAPNTVHASPRLGFRWLRTRTGALISGGDLGMIKTPWASVLSGGIGEFRGITSPTAMLDALSASRSGVSLTCIGLATPTPDWFAYAADGVSGPETCVGGAPADYSDASRTVHLFSRDYTPPRSWRANLAYSMRPGGFNVAFDGTLSYNLDQPGRIDRNLASGGGFVVPGEGRVVYGPASAIVPGSGLIGTSATRLDPAYGPVVEHTSDLRSLSRQLTTSISSTVLPAHYMARFAYTIGSSQAETRGLDGTAFGPVTERSWARGSMPSHQFQTQFGVQAAGVSMTGVARLISGRPFTPMIFGDVNGDGLSNDRAFIDDPASPVDPASVTALQTLLATAPRYASRCLVAQAGGAAGHNSCTGPWTSSLDGMIRVNRPELRAKRISGIELSMTNVLSGFDALVFGGAHGWGQSAFPDPILYLVDGFNPTTNRFQYAVNPDFGRNRASVARLLSPFRLTLEVTIDVGASLPQQRLNFWVRPGRGGNPGRRLTASEIRTRYAAQVTDPYQLVLQLTDSLLITRTQSDSLKRLQAVYKARLDPIWNELTAYMVELGDTFDDRAALQRQEAAIDKGWVITWHAVHEMPGLLNPAQIRLLPGWAGFLYGMSVPGNPRK